MKTINVYYSDFSIFSGLKEVMELVLSEGYKLFKVERVCKNFMEVSFSKDEYNPYFQADYYSKTNCILLVGDLHK